MNKFFTLLIALLFIWNFCDAGRTIELQSSEGESSPVKVSLGQLDPAFSFLPDSLISTQWSNTIKHVQLTLLNTGLTPIAFEFPDYNDHPVDAPLVYCAATSTNCDEFIGRVQLGAIDNNSSCGHYSDFTALSTDIQLNMLTPITVTNGGNAYSTDQVYVWIDFDHNSSFEQSELTTLSTIGGGMSFTGNILAPVTAIPGPTTMRIRMSYSTAANPCGTQSYGEVEDYTVVLRTPTFITQVVPVSGFIPAGGSIQIDVLFSAIGPLYSAPGVYFNTLLVNSNDALATQLNIPAKMIVGCPGSLEGTVTDINTGLPLAGAFVSAGYGFNSYTDGAGHYSFFVNAGSTYSLSFSKIGFDTEVIANVNVPDCNNYTVNAQLSATAYAPECASSSVNPQDTESNTVWCAPHEDIELFYDDGGAENYTAWMMAGNMNAVKFSLQAGPAVVTGGKVYTGDGSYPLGGSFVGQGFGIAVYATDGPGQMPGTLLDSIGVIATTTGWIPFDGLNAIVPAGDFYMVMIQGSNAPDCVPIGIDATLPKAYRSYSRNVVAGEPWILSPYQDMMLHAVVTAPVGDKMENSMHAVVTAPVGDKKTPIATAKTKIPERISGMISRDYPDAIPGTEMILPEMGPATIGSTETIDHYKISRITGFDPVIGVQGGTFTLLDSTLIINTYTESGSTWANVPTGWVAYGIKAVYPYGEESGFTFTNPIPHGLFANVQLEVSLICGGVPAIGAVVTLTGNEYPFTVYTATVLSSGIVNIGNVIAGSYTIQASLPGYSTWMVTQPITGNTNIQVIMEDLKYTPQNLQVDDMTLVASWEPPLSVLLEEDFEGSTFPPNGWQNSYQGFAGWFPTNNGHFGFWDVPLHTWYAMTNDGPNNNGCCDRLITPALNLTNTTDYNLYFDSYYIRDLGLIATVEISIDSCQTWMPIYALTPQIRWVQLMVDLSPWSGSGGADKIWIAFHSDDAGQYSTGWCVDNVRVSSGSVPYQGYAVFLDGALVGQTQQTHWTFNPTTINYGQTYMVGVAGIYCSGYSEQDTAILTSHFLYLPRNLQAMLNTSYINLTWNAPLNGDFQVSGSISRTNPVNSTIEFSPSITQRKLNDQPTVMWDILLEFPAITSGQSAVASDGNFIFTADWNSPGFHKYELNGNWSEDFTIQGAGEIRDFAFNNGIFYATNNTSEILELDLVNQILVGTIPTSLSNLRHIAFDSTLNNGNGGFWTGGWSDENQVRMDGSLIQQIASFNISSCSGSAYDAVNSGGPIMWYFDQGGNGADIYQYDITAMDFTGFVQDVSTIPGFEAGAVAGGLEFQDFIIPAHSTLIGTIQQDPCLTFIYDMGNCVCPPISGCVGYKLYRDDILLAQLPSSQLSYWEVLVNPGLYCYEVTAVYDLTDYGFPGMLGESVKEGPACAPISIGHILPFVEDWIAGTFTLNDWTVGENWVMDGQAGNPAPTVKFTGNPLLTDYSSSLESYWLNATIIDTSSSLHIWLDFDLKLDDQASNSNEIMSVDIWNDTDWVEVANYANSGNLDWTLQHLDITALALNQFFKFRFRAHGVNSFDIQSWYIDNIHVYGIYDLNPPQNLVTQLTGNPQNDIHLTWQLPVGNGTIVTYILDDNIADNGWAINPGYDSWLGNEFTVADIGKLKSIDIFWQTNSSAGNDSLSLDIFDAGRNLLGSSAFFMPSQDNWQTIPLPDLAFEGKFYVMVHWNMLNMQSNYLGSDEDGPNSSSNYGWYFDGSSWQHLSDFGYAPCVFMVRAKAFINGDQPLKYGNASQNRCETIMPPSSLAPSGHKSGACYSKQKISCDYPQSKQGLMSYNLYRREYIDPNTSNILSDWALIANLVQNEYMDMNLVNNCYFYQVTSVYVAGESLPSNESDECIPPSGLPEKPAVGFNLYPNPATSIVTIDIPPDIEFLILCNSLGFQVMKRKTANETHIFLDVSRYPAGVYYVRLITWNGDMLSKKLVVMYSW